MRDNKVSVKQLNAYIKNVFEDELVLQNITVVGEISDVSNSKYVFLTLKEGDCVLQCMSFAKLPLPKIGQKVALGGSVSFSERYAKVTFIFKTLEYVGEGEKQAALEEVKKRLREKGYFEKRRALPRFIKSVCVITSGYGSVIHDFLSGISTHSYVDVSVYPCSVQGDFAEQELLENIKKADKNNFDCIVIARGGGSKEDLACFNLESVAMAVGDSVAPVISAVGHETDYTLCDACAAIRAGTPSFAAKTICDNNAAFISKFVALTEKLSDACAEKLKEKTDSLIFLANNIVYSADKQYTLYGERLNQFADRADKAINASFEEKRRKVRQTAGTITAEIEKIMEKSDGVLSERATALEHLSPLKTLARGYSVVTKDDKTVHSIGDVNVSDKIEVTVMDGKYGAVVCEKEKSL